MLTLKDLEQRQKDIFGYEVNDALLIDKASMKRAREQINSNLEID